MGPEVSFRHPRYEVIRLLGEGGMGRVYLARDLLQEREVALKVYPARAHAESLKREFLALRDLHHPGIARAFHFGISAADGSPFFTLEHVEGEPIDEHLERYPRTPAAAGKEPSPRAAAGHRLFTLAAGAAAYLHRRGVLHLDLKPQNILVVQRGSGAVPRPVLIDFGLVRTAGGGGPAVHGTVAFASPEVLRGEQLSPASDVYSLGATFYRLFSGRYPVEGADDASSRRAHALAAPAPIPECPPAIERILLRALARDPARRFANGGELHQALLAALPGIPAASPALFFHEPDFSGRKRELAALERWAANERRQPAVFVVRGGSGMGKTRFLEQAETLLESQGKEVILLRAAEGARSLLTSGVRHLDVIVPQPGEGKSRRRQDPEAGEDDLAARLGPLLAGGAFLLVDDFDLAVPRERDVIWSAARALEGSPAPRGGIVLARSLVPGRPGAEAPSTAVEIGPLSLAEALAIEIEGLDGALAALPAARARGLKVELHRRTGGHPLFYVRGLLDLAGDPAAVKLAPTERILDRVGRLPSAARAVAAALACLARPATLAETAGITAADRKGTLAALELLRGEGILAANDRQARLIHESVRNAILAALDPEERKAVHARIADFLTREQDPSAWAEAAWHAFEAGNDSLALALASRAIEGELPLATGRGDQVIAALSRAAGASRQGSAERARFLEAAAGILEASARYEECLAALSEIAGKRPARGRSLADPQAVRRLRKLGSAAHRAGCTELALARLSDCVSPTAERAAPIEALRARAELALLHHFRGETDRALAHARRGLDLWRRAPRAERGEGTQSAVDLHGILGQIHIRRLQFDEAIRFLEEGLRLAVRGSGSKLSLLLNNLALANHLAGRFEAALATFERAAALARQTGDEAALLSIRLNVAQIHAKKGQFQAAAAELQRLETLPAASQSKRHRLWFLYTQSLLANLLGVEADKAWAEVESFGAKLNDAFLTAFARLYRAEEALRRGDLKRAREFLDRSAGLPGEEALVVDAMRTARCSFLEALAGNPRTAARARHRARDAARLCPSLLRAWNDLYLGLSATETEDWSEASAHLAEAGRAFHATGFAAGQIECALALADLHLRQRPRSAARLRAVEREIEAARRVSVDPPPEVSPRSRDLRAAILEARLLIARRFLGFPIRGGTAAPSDRDDPRAQLSDLVARAGGDPGLARDADLRTAADLIAAAAARLAGDGASARAVQGRVRSPHGAAGRSPRDPWRRFGLEEARPFCGTPALGAARGEALAAILEITSRMAVLPEGPGAGEAREGLLSRILALAGKAIGASRVELGPGGEVLHAWGAAAERRAPGQAASLTAALRLPGASQLRAFARRGRQFTAADEAFLEAAARALAPYAGRSVLANGGAPEEDAGKARRATALLSGTPGDPAATRTLPARGMPGASQRTAALSRFLENEGFIAGGREMQRLLRALRALAASDLPVLITGESGTGKNLVASLLHRLGPRSGGPFVSQNAGAVPRELFEADLFGHEVGAFTGAERSRTGFLFQAGGGTFHLEEIGDLDPALQQSLLRVIEEKVVRPLGATTTRQLDVRFVASTARDIDQMVRRGEFRKDLFFRLAGARLQVPPLRQRLEELPVLARRYWREFTGSTARLPQSALEALAAHDWPGNVRELVSVLRRLSLEATGTPSASDVRAALGQATPGRQFPPALFATKSFGDLERALEESYLEYLHGKHGGDLDRIARELGTSTRSVYRRFERLGWKPKDLKKPGG